MLWTAPGVMVVVVVSESLSVVVISQPGTARTASQVNAVGCELVLVAGCTLCAQVGGLNLGVADSRGRGHVVVGSRCQRSSKRGDSALLLQCSSHGDGVSLSVKVRGGGLVCSIRRRSCCSCFCGASPSIGSNRFALLVCNRCWQLEPGTAGILGSDHRRRAT